jgi:hypothetical protein
MRLWMWTFVFALWIGTGIPQTAKAQAGTFTTTGSLNTPRYYHTATLLPNGKVLLAGGYSNAVGTPLATAELYTPSTGTFSYTGSLRTGREMHTATPLSNGEVLIAGGITGATSSTATFTAELYNPANGQFSYTGNLNTARYNASATLLSNGQVLLTGGDNSSGFALSSAELYDPVSGKFSYTTGSLNTARDKHSATLLGNGEVLIGGVPSGLSPGLNNVSSLELYNPNTGTFSVVTGSSGIFYGLPALLGNGNVLFLGFSTFNSELYNTTTGTVSSAKSYASGFTGFYTQTLLYDGTLLIAGGESSGGSTNVAQLYTYGTGATSSTGSLKYGRAVHTATLLGNGQVLIAGGVAGACGRGGCQWNMVAPGELYNSPGIMGFINPKYVIVGVTYAPPGPSSNVTYSNSTFVGNTTTTTGSFTNDNNLTISVSKDIGAWSIIGGAAVKLSASSSTDYTQGSNTSSTVTISKQTAVSDKTNGTGNVFSPVNHDYDTIWLWLNPLMVYTVFPNSPNSLQWNGYGYDNNDVNGVDIFGVQVGWLNGDFGPNPSIQTVLARGWVTKNEPGMIWPAGEGPGLTSADIANILKADPLTSSSYTLPSPLPSTSADGRFTQIPYPPNPVNYVQAGLGNGGGTTAMYNAVYTNTSVVGSGASYTFKQAFGTEQNFSGGTWLVKFTLDLKESDTLTWTHAWQNTLTTTTTLTDALSVTGPGCPQTSPPCVPAYAGPGEFIVYQDNLYGTFMFYPGN